MNLLQKFCFIFGLLQTTCLAQNLNANLYTSHFNTPENHPFLELYLAIDASSIMLQQTDNNTFCGEVNISIQLTKENQLFFVDNYILKSPQFTDSVANQIFIDLQRIPITNGIYTLKVVLADKILPENQIIKEQKIDIHYKDNTISVSEIELVEKFVPSTTENILSKNGFDMTPYVSNFYPPSIKTLDFFFEIYHTDKLFGTKGKYLLNTYIETFETQTPLNDFFLTKRMEAKPLQSNLFSFPIDQLPTGNYQLVAEIKDEKNHSILVQKLFFQRIGLFNNKQLSDISSVDIVGSFVEQITHKDSMLLFIDYLYPISTPNEKTFASNQKNYDDILLMQKFFLNFWKGRNLHHPEQEWQQYKNVVEMVNREFRNGKILGYLTDRGRVFLQYGPPNSRNKVENSSANLPYEIWHYYKLNNQSDRKFVFANEHLGIQDYRLTYSNVEGEVSNMEWRDEIKQDANPTFGDDFNNNYINPR